MKTNKASSAQYSTERVWVTIEAKTRKDVFKVALRLLSLAVRYSRFNLRIVGEGKTKSKAIHAIEQAPRESWKGVHVEPGQRSPYCNLADTLTKPDI